MVRFSKISISFAVRNIFHNELFVESYKQTDLYKIGRLKYYNSSVILYNLLITKFGFLNYVKPINLIVSYFIIICTLVIGSFPSKILA
jgi:hypothetical protein